MPAGRLTFDAILVALFVVQFSAANLSQGFADDAMLSARVDELFSKWDRPDVAGCAVGIVRDGDLIYSKGFGSAHLDYEVPNTPETVFEVGSAAKSFTAACVALLLDRGEISLDDDIRKYVPELHPHHPPIRIRHLIRCRSGLWAQWHLVQLAGWSSEPIQAPYTNEDLLTLLAGQKTLPFTPGTQFQYGSSDYFLLGIVTERVTGMPLGEFARENLFKPLGMNRTSFEQDPTAIVKNRAVGYYRDRFDDVTIWRSWKSNAGGPGGWDLKSCVVDLAKWERNFPDDQLGGGMYFEAFLREGTLLDNRNVLDATPTGSYRGVRRIQFTGGMPGYAAAMTRFPDQQFTVICLSNNSTEITPWKMAQRIADIYLAEELDATEPDAQPSREASPAALTNKDHWPNMVGTYRSEHSHIWRISYRDGELFNTNHLNETYVLHPLGEMRFRPDPYPDDTFVFGRTDDNEEFALVLEYDGGSLRYDRVKLVDPTSVLLDDYVGEFYSDELAITYRFQVKDGFLAVRVGNRRWEPLDPTMRDEFIPHVRRGFDNRIFTFQRDDNGKVVGVRVALWRVQGIEFNKR